MVEQGGDDCEIVVVDDGSTDASWSVIKQFGIPAFCIENSGQRAACLYGLNKTRAPFVLFLDADDEPAPGAIARILTKIDPTVAKLQYPLTCIDEAGQVITSPYPALHAFRGRGRIVDEILRSGVYQTPPTSGNVSRRDVCELLHPCGYDNAVDGVTLLAAPFMGDVVSLSDPLGLCRVRGRNDSGLGQTLQVKTLERDLRRFQLRLAHLGRLLNEIQPDAGLIKAEDTYYFRSLEFAVVIMGGSRYSIGSFLSLFRALMTEPRSLKWKAANTLIMVTAFLAPLRYAQAILKFRYLVGQRSVRQFLRIARSLIRG